MDLKTADELLTTTRSVRKRLDFSKPVDPADIERCIAIALQAPTGSNQQGWHFLIVTDLAKRKGIGDLYNKAFQLYVNAPESMRPSIPKDDPRFAQTERIIDSAAYLAQHMHEAPVMVIPCIEGRVENAGALAQASVYGSILPAAWSFMLALRARDLGTAWTTLHLVFEHEAAKLLGIPDNITQAALFPVARYSGGSFKPAKRLPAAGRTHWNQWGTRHR
jgi:nitroreductase